jgi:hypothetical protein
MRSKKTWRLLILILVALIIAAVIVAAMMGLLAPVRMALRFPVRFLVQEAQTMDDCRKCHKPEEFHNCQTCHGVHGSVDMPEVPFDDLLLLQGDVPEAGYIPINDILPYREYTRTHVALLDFLAQQKVTDFESVTLVSRDEGFVTIERPNLTPSGLLMPHTDGMRFADENLHVSSWLKGVWRIIVVGKETPLQIDGQPTSIGRLLLGPTRSVTIEQTDTMFKSLTDGQVRRAKTAARIEGVPIEIVVAHPSFEKLVVRDKNGRETILTAEEARGALLLQVRNQVTLVLPTRNTSQWIADVVEVTSQGTGG